MHLRNVLAASASSNNRPTIVPDRPEKHIRPTRNGVDELYVDELYIDLLIARLTEAGDAPVLRHKGQGPQFWRIVKTSTFAAFRSDEPPTFGSLWLFVHLRLLELSFAYLFKEDHFTEGFINAGETVLWRRPRVQLRPGLGLKRAVMQPNAPFYKPLLRRVRQIGLQTARTVHQCTRLASRVRQNWAVGPVRPSLHVESSLL
jgi:hypothetical protein